jgi:predicted  nucleic acid-binding Zn-ribbon protein
MQKKPFRFVPFLLAALAGAPAFAAAPAVDLKNDESRSVSVPLGSDNGVTSESDFEAAAEGGATVPVFPAEIFRDRFWSAPLSPEDYGAIRVGASVRPLQADRTAHRLMRQMAAEQRRALGREQAEAGRAEAARKVAALKERRDRLSAEREKLEGWIADADRGIADERERAQRREDGAEQDALRAQQRIDDLVDQRNELQSQRDALPREDRAGRERLTDRIRALNSRISSERDSLRSAQDRFRESRSSLRRESADRRKMAADRDALAAEIKSLDRQIADAEAKAKPER